MAGLHGEFRHKLDAKGRLSLPAAFRKALAADNLIVTPSPKSDCLYVFEADKFDAWVDSLFARDGGFNSFNSKHVAQRKLLNSRAKDVEVDNAGRIGVSADYRALAGLEREVVLIGDSDHFEIWDGKRWDDFAAACDLDDLFV